MKTGASFNTPSRVSRMSSPARTDEGKRDRIKGTNRRAVAILRRWQSQQFMDDAPLLEHAELGPLLRADSRKFDDRCSHHFGRDRFRARVLAASVAFANDAS